MIVLRQGRAKTLLENSVNSALTAVETYNRPRTNFRIENYIILMVIAWTKLFHAYFQSAMGEKYFYKEKNGRYKIVDGEKKAWELKECIKQYQKIAQASKLPDAAIANLHFFIGLRNKIEHRFWDSSALDIMLFGECQSLLFNYENLLVSLFGEDYSINTCLAYALQFSHMRAPEQLRAQHQLLSKDMLDIKRYIDKYKTDLPQTVFDSQEYSVKLLQIPKVSNTNRSDLSVEFVNWNSLSEEDRENYSRITAIIKDKIVKQRVANADLIKPSTVCSKVKERTGIEISTNKHAFLWKSFGIRPSKGAKDKFETNETYCIYDEPHDDYLYTEAWIDFIVNLIQKHEFTADNILEKCNAQLDIAAYE